MGKFSSDTHHFYDIYSGLQNAELGEDTILILQENQKDLSFEL